MYYRIGSLEERILEAPRLWPVYYRIGSLEASRGCSPTFCAVYYRIGSLENWDWDFKFIEMCTTVIGGLEALTAFCTVNGAVYHRIGGLEVELPRCQIKDIVYYRIGSAIIFI